LQQISLGTLQILGLCAFNAAGVWIVQRTSLPIPGNLVGMIALYALLAAGVIKLSWFEVAGSFLVRQSRILFCADYCRADGCGISVCDKRYRDHPHTRSKRRHRHFTRWMDFAASAP